MAALAERLGWDLIDHLSGYFGPSEHGWDVDWKELRAEFNDNGWHLTLAGVAACIEGLDMWRSTSNDGGSIITPLSGKPAYGDTLTEAVQAAVQEMFEPNSTE